MRWILDSLKSLKNSENLALVNRFESLTFHELWNRSEFIARDISRFEKKTPVVIYGNKDIDIVPTMVAALKTGRAYIPVDITFPVSRLETIATMVDACVIYNYSGETIDLPFVVRDKNYVCDEIYNKIYDGDLPETDWVDNEDPCYILFTSGSTGSPKGVPINKENILNYSSYFSKTVESFEIGNHILLPVSFSFDVSVVCLYVYLPQGRTLFFVDKPLLNETEQLVRWIVDNDITHFQATPSFLDICIKSDEFCAENLPNLKLFLMIGEVLPKQTVIKTYEKFPHITIMNTYGPTESTVQITDCVISKEMMEDSRSLPIGRMMPEADWYLENNEGCRCEDGEQGELIVVSKSVSAGYYLDPERSAKAFFRSEDGRMAYRTGDVVVSDSGMLYFLGRKDFQVKLHGYRIEIEDISNNLDKVSCVSRNAVLPVYTAEGTVDYIAAFVTLQEPFVQESKLKNTIRIKKELGELVPAYMLPRKIIFLKDFKLNTNGKIDRKELAKLLEN